MKADFVPIIHRWLHVLNSNSYIRNEEKEYYFEKKMHYSELEKIWVDGKNVWENANLGTISTYEYFKNNALKLNYIMKGELNPTLLLFPEGQMYVADDLYSNNSGLWEFVNSTKEKRFEAYAKAIEKKTCINVSAELLEATFEIYQHGFKGANVELPFYSGDICYLSACEEQKYFFADKNQNLEMWNDICLGEFEVINVPGNHVTCIHSEENATLLAQIIIERNIRG